MATNNLLKKLLAFQSKVKAITKEETNPFLKKKYFDINGLIATIKPILNEVGIVVIQPIFQENGKNILRTIVADPDTDERIGSEMILPDNADIQKYGGVITYCRRYALQSALLLEAEDDDGHEASRPAPMPVNTASKPVTQIIRPAPVQTPPGIVNKVATTPAAKLMKQGFAESKIEEEKINVEDIPF